MSLENFSTSLHRRHTFQISTHHFNPWAPLVFPTDSDNNEKPTPSRSPSSSTVSSHQEEEEDIKSWPDEVFSPYSPATIYSSYSSVGTPINESPLTTLLEPQTARFKGLKLPSKIFTKR